MSDYRRLAILGGDPVISEPLKLYTTIDEKEVEAATRVIRSRKLSQFIGDAGEYFLGGHEVRSFETEFALAFNTKHAITVNSWTSGLWAALGALEIEPGNEVITSSWTMAAAATTILHWNLVPVFADIDPRTFNLDVVDVERRITSRTRAIVSPDIFGQSADIESLLLLCKKYDLALISDAAQSPMSKRNGYFAGTAAHIGGFSFNYHKHIHTGEGGMLVTNNDALADRLTMLRNHGEVALSKRRSTDWQYGIMGMNMRLGEIESAIGKSQLSKLQLAIQTRNSSAHKFIKGIMHLSGIIPPYVSPENQHVFYILGLILEPDQLNIPRSVFCDALQAEGVPNLIQGYQNLHRLPLFANQLTYKKNPLPYSLLSKKRAKELRNVSLPIAEKLHQESFLGLNWCAHEFEDSAIESMVEAFSKVWINRHELLDF